MRLLPPALALVGLLACAKTRDYYAGSDTPLAVEAGTGATTAAGAPAPEPEPIPDASPSVTAVDAGPSAVPDAEPPPLPVVCAAGSGDCDGSAANGCEIDLLRDPDHCGTCAHACSAPDCACVDGAFVTVCEAPRADCDGDPDNGCEADTASDLEHCGGCGRICHADGHDALDASCNRGRCELTCQNASFEIDCDGDPDNGCEAYIAIDSENCGACGVRCPCANGVCI
jgi:hypothetical protein